MKQTASLKKADESIVVVLVDQYSLDWAKENRGWGWPWPRAAYGEMVDFFTIGNTSSVAFDMLFTEPSVFGSEDDKAFAESCKNSGKIVQTLYRPDNDSEIYPIPEILYSAAIIGDVTGIKDSDDIHRRARLFTSINGKEIPSLSAASLLVSGGSIETFNENKRDLFLRYKQNESNFDKYSMYSAAHILQSNEERLNNQEMLLSPEEFEGTHIFIGLYAPGLFDICSSSMSASYPGMGIHVTALDNILCGDFIRKTPVVVDYLIALFFSVLGIGIVIFNEKKGNHKYAVLRSCIAFVLCIVIYGLLSIGLFALGLWISFIFPLSALILSYVAATLIGYNTEGKQRRYIKSAFKQYLSPVIIEELISHPEQLKLGGERRNITIFFSDLQNFTTVSESLEPEQLTELLNDFLSAMTDIILAHGGTIDKYEGDAIIAFWNAPTDQKDHAAEALAATIECQQKLEQMREPLHEKYGAWLFMRVGLNTGNAIVGNMGSVNHFNYTMLGDSVNLASRLEGLNKQFGTYTMCSKATMEQAKEQGCRLCFRELADVQVVGKTEPIRVFEPMIESEYNNRKELIKRFSEAREFFTKGDFERAKKEFDALSPRDPVSKKYSERCTTLENKNIENWCGIWLAESK